MPGYKVKVLKSRLDKMKGLIGAEKPYPIFFKTRWGIHTFGVRFPIDVLILDGEFKVVKAVANLPPNRILFWPIFYENVLELPAGEIERQQIKLGDKIKLLPKCLLVRL
jgi:hypothetical protein